MTILLTPFFSLLLCLGYLFIAKKMDWRDFPKTRSAHVVPTSSGGGLAIFIAFCLAVVFFREDSETRGFSNLVLCVTILLAVVGFLDDIYKLKVVTRISTYLFLSWAAILVLFSENSFLVITYIEIFLVSLVFCLFMNLYNFMDGIDGFLAVHCIISTGIAALLLSSQSDSTDLLLVCSVLGFVHLGFLFLNWAPAKLFMGDAGSIPSGFVLGAIAIESILRGFIPLSAWLIIFSPFLADSSWTLLVRFISGKNILEPHSSHLYQRLARRWNSHSRVVLILALFQCVWCAPLSYLVLFFPQQEINFVVLAYLPLVIGLVSTRDFA